VECLGHGWGVGLWVTDKSDLRTGAYAEPSRNRSIGISETSS
jgi:hypothetical protein